MRSSGMKWMVGAVALSAFLAFSGASHASCTGGNRISVGSADCLSAGYSNTCDSRMFGKCVSYTSSFWAQKVCTGGRKVVAKIDLKSATDLTWHLTNTGTRNGSASYKVNGIYCCRDLGRCD